MMLRQKVIWRPHSLYLRRVATLHLPADPTAGDESA